MSPSTEAAWTTSYAASTAANDLATALLTTATVMTNVVQFPAKLGMSKRMGAVIWHMSQVACAACSADQHNR